MLRTLIADDEPLALRGLRARLHGHPELVVVGEARSGREAVDLVRSLRPDILFLDVEMPGLDGLAVLRELGRDVPPHLVFVTAYDEYAVEAFRVRALDYLLKPVSAARLRETVQRLLAKTVPPPGATSTAIGELLRSRRIAVRSGEKTILLPVEDIVRVEAEGDYVRIHTSRGSHLHRSTMKGIAEQLDERFLRIHRGHFVRVDLVVEIHPLLGGERMLVLRDGSRVRSGRSYRRALLETFGGL